MNIDRYRDPSTLLCAICQLVWSWDDAELIDSAWLPIIDRILANEVSVAVDLDPSPLSDLLLDGEGQLLRAGREANPELGTLLEVIRILQKLDMWHEPLMLASGPDTELDPDHDDALYRLYVDGGGYNVSEGTGTLIPPATPGLERDGRTDEVGVLARYLHFTAYLPPSGGAGDPDSSTALSDRRVDLRYVASLAREADGRGEIGEHPVIAVAPVLQERDDAEVIVRTVPDRYGVELRYHPKRLHELVALTISEKAHLLFMPEMTIDAEKVDDLAAAIRRATSDHLSVEGELPALRYVVAGISGGGTGTGGNSIVVLNTEGREILRQDKLCRWNLKPHHQRNYQLRPTCADGDPDLVEDIEGGSVVWIADLLDLGRFLTLICADMDYDKPGDWLLRNVAVDWLHAPIMDKSIAWSRDASGALQPWIVARAHRAAERGVPKVIVTNSMLLSLTLNETNSRPGSRYPVLDECSVAFMLDRKGTSLTFKQMMVPLPTSTPVVRAVRWPIGFSAFPPSC